MVVAHLRKESLSLLKHLLHFGKLGEGGAEFYSVFAELNYFAFRLLYACLREEVLKMR